MISKDCNLCHLVLDQKQENIPAGARVTGFVYPVDIGDESVKTMNQKLQLEVSVENGGCLQLPNLGRMSHGGGKNKGNRKNPPEESIPGGFYYEALEQVILKKQKSI